MFRFSCECDTIEEMQALFAMLKPEKEVTRYGNGGCGAKMDRACRPVQKEVPAVQQELTTVTVTQDVVTALKEEPTVTVTKDVSTPITEVTPAAEVKDESAPAVVEKAKEVEVAPSTDVPQRQATQEVAVAAKQEEAVAATAVVMQEEPTSTGGREPAEPVDVTNVLSVRDFALKTADLRGSQEVADMLREEFGSSKVSNIACDRWPAVVARLTEMRNA